MYMFFLPHILSLCHSLFVILYFAELLCLKNTMHVCTCTCTLCFNFNFENTCTSAGNIIKKSQVSCSNKIIFLLHLHSEAFEGNKCTY